jgi:hypothetical protein
MAHVVLIFNSGEFTNVDLNNFLGVFPPSWVAASLNVSTRDAQAVDYNLPGFAPALKNPGPGLNKPGPGSVPTPKKPASPGPGSAPALNKPGPVSAPTLKKPEPGFVPTLEKAGPGFAPALKP